MKRINKFLTLSLLCAALSNNANAATFIGDRTDFRDETIYFAMTTRFYDGDTGNNVYCWDGKNNVNDPEWRGDFKGLIKKLDYIKSLGFTAVWISPVVENASGLDYHGYHPFNFKKVDPRYESEDCKFQDLIDAAHQRGMKIILDVVLNHTGNFGEDTLCPMFEKDYSKNLSNILGSMKLHTNSVLPADYDLGDKNAHDPRINAMKNEDGQNHDKHNYYHHVGTQWNWDDYSRWYAQIAGDCVDLNTENPAVTEYLVDCYGKFIAMGVDGFRIDTSGHISRLTFNKAFIPQFTALAEKYKDKRNGGDFFMFGEVCARERNVVYRGHANCSPYFYTWKEEKDYAWDYSTTSWDNEVITDHSRGKHTNILSQDQQGKDYDNDSFKPNSTNALLSGNQYHTPDHSQFSGLSVIDFPMHWNFRTAAEAWGVRYGDKYYNDATYNVVYVDSHDYAPDGAPESQRFSGSQSTWAENLDLMFTFRGIPCLYYGSEIEFKKGCLIDKGAELALKNSGRAYFGGYIEGDVKVNDFADYSAPTGNMAASLSHPLSLHIQRLNKLRAAIPALRKGQYSTDGCSAKGLAAFKRRYTDSNTDSYVLVSISGGATFSGIENGVYTDAITGDVKVVDNNTLIADCSGKGNMRIYVLSTPLTAAPGKIGADGAYLFADAAVTVAQLKYDGNEEPEDLVTIKEEAGGGSSVVDEPETPVTPAMNLGEQALFFENSEKWSGKIKVWCWSASQNFTGGKWPGETATYLGNNIWKWTYNGNAKIPENAGVVFSNGSSQTKDLTFVNGGYYNASGYLKTIEGAGEIPEPEPRPVSAPVKVFYDNSVSNWPEVGVYMWHDAGDLIGKWPGKKMTETIMLNDKVVYTFTLVPDCELLNPKVIFNNNGNGQQTADLQLVEYGLYNNAGFLEATSAIRYENIADDMIVYASQGILNIIAKHRASVMVYGVDGRQYRITVNEGSNTYHMQPGIYFIAGKKIKI